MRQNQSNHYYYELDILRGIACLLVFCAHFPITQLNLSLFPSFISGNGVYLFFIISGFIIVKTFDSQFSKTDDFTLESWYAAIRVNRTRIYLFWHNRFVRLFPALCLLVICSGLVVLRYGINNHDIISSITAFFTYIINFFFIDSSFLTITLDLDKLTPKQTELLKLCITCLGVSWSLKCEILFYLIFPFVIVLKKFECILPIIFIVVFLLKSIFVVSVSLNYAPLYFNIFGHFDSFIIGMLIAYYHKRIKLSRNIAITFTIISLYTLIIGTIDWKYYEYYLHLLLSSAFLVYMSASEINVLNPFYIGKILNFIGIRSYFIYLMHFVIKYIMYPSFYALLCNLAKYIPHLNALILKESSAIDHIIHLLLLFLIVILADLFYRFIERPFIQKYKKCLGS